MTADAEHEALLEARNFLAQAVTWLPLLVEKRHREAKRVLAVIDAALNNGEDE